MRTTSAFKLRPIVTTGLHQANLTLRKHGVDFSMLCLIRRWQKKATSLSAAKEGRAEDGLCGSLEVDCCQPQQHPELSAEQRQEAEWKLAALFLEGGIVFHSMFVGINFGVTENNSTSTALMIALIFHQVLPPIFHSAVLLKYQQVA